MHGHLIAIEVSVEGGADQRMDLDGLTLNENGLEGLNAQPVQRWRTVEQHGVFLDHLIQAVPYLGRLFLHHLLGAFDGGHIAALLQLVVDEWFK